MNAQRRRELLIYDIVRDGHRRDYFKVLRRVLGGQVVWGPLRQRWPLLLGAQRLLCSTCDDYLVGFFMLALARAVLGRPTLGLSVRSETIFLRSGPAQWVKRALLLLLKWLPQVKVVTLMPYWVEPRLGHYTADWMYDMQFWDARWLDAAPQQSLTDIARQLAQAANGRQVVASIGHLRQVKGVAFLMELQAQPALRERFLFACIGPNWDLPADQVKAFTEAGGLFLDTDLHDDQIIPLYAIVDLVWACYRPEYNQSSGIFGRALQLGKLTVVRQGSYLDRLQQELAPAGLRIPYGDVGGAVALMAASTHTRPQPLEVAPDRAFALLQRLLGQAPRDGRRAGRSE